MLRRILVPSTAPRYCCRGRLQQQQSYVPSRGFSTTGKSSSDDKESKRSSDSGGGLLHSIASWFKRRPERAAEKLEAAKSQLRSTGPSEKLVQSLDETMKLPSDVLLRTKSVKQLRELANAAFNGSGVETDKKRAIGLWAAAAMKGDPASALQLAVCFLRGDGVDKDEDKAIEILEDIIDNVKLPWASFALANIYTQRHQKLETETDEKIMRRCFELYKNAAIGGVAPAYLNVYNFLTMGVGCQKNEAEALEWLRDAAQAQDPMAMYYMAARYSRGAGVEQDAGKAFELFRRAAKKGIANAAHNVGVALMEGKGCEVNFEEAMKWLTLATDKRHVPSMLNLGLLHERGLGTGQDVDKALAWYMVAATTIAQQEGSKTKVPRYVLNKITDVTKLRNDPDKTKSIQGKLPEVEEARESEQEGFSPGITNSTLEFSSGLPNEGSTSLQEITVDALDQETARKFIEEAQKTDMTPDSLDSLLKKHIKEGNIRLKKDPSK